MSCLARWLGDCLPVPANVLHFVGGELPHSVFRNLRADRDPIKPEAAYVLAPVCFDRTKETG